MLNLLEQVHLLPHHPHEYTVEKAPEATWITSVKKLDGNAVEITADLDSYVDNHPRTSYITIKANNVTKKIPVTQRPDRGTIKIHYHGFRKFIAGVLQCPDIKG